MTVTGTNGTFTGNAQTEPFQARGPVHLHLSGNFSSGTIQLQALSPSGVWKNLANSAFTSAVDKDYDFPPNAYNVLRLDFSGSSPTPSLFWWLQAGGKGG